MYCPAVVTECFLRKTLWISACLCTLRPGVAVTVQANTGDSSNTTPAAKFCGAMIAEVCLILGNKSPESVGFEPTTNRLIPTLSGPYHRDYIFIFSRRSRIRRADFQFLISRSRSIAAQRSRCFSEHTRTQRPFLRVNFLEILSVRL